MLFWNRFLKLRHMLRCLDFTFWLYFWTCWFGAFWGLGIWRLWHFGTLGFCDFWSLGLSDFCLVEISSVFGTSDFESFLYLCPSGFELLDFGTWDFWIFWLFDCSFFILDFVLLTTQIINTHVLTIYAAIRILDFWLWGRDPCSGIPRGLIGNPARPDDAASPGKLHQVPWSKPPIEFASEPNENPFKQA